MCLLSTNNHFCYTLFDVFLSCWLQSAFSVSFWLQLFHVLKNAVVVARQLLFCSSFIEKGLWIPTLCNTEVRAVQNAGIWKKRERRRLLKRSDGFESAVSEVVTSLLGKCCQWLRAEGWTASLIFVRELGQGWSRGWRHSWRTNCTAPPLTPHTRSWVVLGAVTSHVSRRALKSSCTCRTWPPCWRAARL